MELTEAISMFAVKIVPSHHSAVQILGPHSHGDFYGTQGLSPHASQNFTSNPAWLIFIYVNINKDLYFFN